MTRFSLAAATMVVTMAAAAQDNGQTPAEPASEPLSSAYRLSGTEENARLSYQGDANRVGIGVDNDGDVYGEFFYLFNDSQENAWLGEGWVSKGAGGLKLNYHWLSGLSFEEAAAQPDEARVNKAFIAVDQNAFDDRKATLGLGFEKQQYFLGGYVSREFTGRRFVGQTIDTIVDQISGVQDGRDFLQDRTIQTITRLYEHPYEYGVGVRLGRYFDDSLFRVRGGLDYEDGKQGSSQFTASLGFEKFFHDSGHSLALNLEHYDRSGDFVADESENRATLFYRYHFGSRSNYGQQITHREKQVVSTTPAVPAATDTQVFNNRITVSEQAFFDLDRSEVRPDAADALARLVDRIAGSKLLSDIQVVGHTCDLGTDEYNLRLSQRRASSARQFLLERGLDQVAINATGEGEANPRYPNDTEASRQRNRRVEIEFLTLESEERTITTAAVPGEEQIEWVKEPVTDPAWIKRALRNPIQHKRTVDTYRIEESESTETLGPMMFINQDPGAVDDAVSIGRNSSGTAIDVLANDSDGDGDTLTIVSVTDPLNGAATTDGLVVIYTPAQDYTGADSFEYVVEDGNGGTASATVSIDVVNSPPVAGDDAATVLRGQSVTIAALSNDSDVDGGELTLESVTGGVLGSAIISGQSVIYAADSGQIGVDTLTYVVRDADGDTATGTISVTVENNLPVAVADSASVPRAGTVDINVLANDSDPDGEDLTVLSVSMPSSGSVFIKNKAIVTYEAADGFRGVVTFNYEVSDADGGTASAVVSVTVANGVPIAVNDTAQTAKDTPVSIDVLANDSDPDNDPLTVIAVSPRETGFGVVEIQSDNTVLYTPNPGWWGGDSFSYTISDGLGGEATATVNLTITEFE